MTMSEVVLIWGHSDDCIEVDGAISDEFYRQGESTTIEFDDGRQFTVTYTGEWTIECENPEQLHTVDYSEIAVYDVGVVDLFNDYSEVAVYQSWDGVNSVEVIDNE